MTGGEEKQKLTVDRPRLGSMRMRHLANLLSYPPMRGIRLGGLELVIMKGREEWHTATATSQGVAPAEVTQPRPNKAWQHEDTTSRARVRVVWLRLEWSP